MPGYSVVLKCTVIGHHQAYSVTGAVIFFCQDRWALWRCNYWHVPAQSVPVITRDSLVLGCPCQTTLLSSACVRACVVVDRFYIALFSALEQTHWACMWFCMSNQLFIAHLWICTELVCLTALTWLVPHDTAAVSARCVYIIQPCTMSLHAYT